VLKLKIRREYDEKIGRVMYPSPQGLPCANATRPFTQSDHII